MLSISSHLLSDREWNLLQVLDSPLCKRVRTCVCVRVCVCALSELPAALPGLLDSPLCTRVCVCVCGLCVVWFVFGCVCVCVCVCVSLSAPDCCCCCCFCTHQSRGSGVRSL